MRKLVLGLLLAGSSVFCVPALAATLYISDQFTVPLRRGPSNSHRILHQGLPSGTALEVLGTDDAAGFTQVRTANGTEGWIPTQYLSSQPVARDRLAAADRRVESLEAQVKNLRQSDGRANDLAKQTDKLQAELTEIRRISRDVDCEPRREQAAQIEQRDAAEASHATDRACAPAGAQRHAEVVAGGRRPRPARIADRRLDQVATQAQQLGVS